MRERERGRGGRSKREIKRTSVENDCLFDEGVITIRQGEASTFVKGVIPEERENWKDRAEGGGRICERRGEEIEREQMQRERERERAL